MPSSDTKTDKKVLRPFSELPLPGFCPRCDAELWIGSTTPHPGEFPLKCPDCNLAVYPSRYGCERR